MKKLTLALLFLLTTLFYAQDSEKIKLAEDVLELSGSKETLDQMMTQITEMVFTSLLKNDGSSEEKKDFAVKTLSQLMKEEMQWDSLKEMIVPIYVESFTKSELEGLIDFYNSDAGKAFIKKLPEIMQKSMVAGQTLAQQKMPVIMGRFTKALEQYEIEEQAKQEQSDNGEK